MKINRDKSVLWPYTNDAQASALGPRSNTPASLPILNQRVRAAVLVALAFAKAILVIIVLVARTFIAASCILDHSIPHSQRGRPPEVVNTDSGFVAPTVQIFRGNVDVVGL